MGLRQTASLEAKGGEQSQFDKFKKIVTHDKNLCSGIEGIPHIDPDIVALLVTINSNSDLVTTQSCGGHNPTQIWKRQPLFMKKFPDGGFSSAHISFESMSRLNIWEIIDIKIPVYLHVSNLKDGLIEYVIWWEPEDSLDGQEQLIKYFLERSDMAPDYTFMEYVWMVSPPKWWARQEESVDPRDLD